MTGKRFWTRLLCVLFCLALASSLLCIVQHTGHVCQGDQCPECLLIAACESLLRLLCCAALAALCCLLLFQKHFFRVFRRARAVRFPTLVALKVKLSD